MTEHHELEFIEKAAEVFAGFESEAFYEHNLFDATAERKAQFKDGFIRALEYVDINEMETV